MAMSELKQKLLLYELAKIGFRDAQYHPISDRIHLQPDNDRMPKINNAGDIGYGTEYGNLAINTLRPLVDSVNEVVAAWEKSSKMPFEDLSQFRVLAEYNNIMMAARDDTVYGRGLHFVTWQYNYNRTGLDHGHYMEDYNAVKEDFAERSGLISGLKLFSEEQAAEIKASIDYRINNDGDITLKTEETLKSIAARLRAAYPGKETHDMDSKTEKFIEPENKQEFIFAKEFQDISNAINGEIRPDDWVIAMPPNAHGYLVGQVTKVTVFGSVLQDSGNLTDDIHVNFAALEYTDIKKAELLESLDHIYTQAKTFDDMPLDDVIMAPKSLVRITELGYDEIDRLATDFANAEAFCKCFISPSLHHGAKFEELVMRVDKNLADYHKILDGFGQGELIDMAGRIDVMNEAHHYLTLCYDFSANELDFYLQFENPLEIVADELNNRRNFSDDLDYSMESLNERRDLILSEYPLIKETNTTVFDKLPEVENTPAKVEKTTNSEKPKTLEEKMQAAKEKVKAQDAHNDNKKTYKRDERD